MREKEIRQFSKKNIVWFVLFDKLFKKDYFRHFGFIYEKNGKLEKYIFPSLEKKNGHNWKIRIYT